MAKVMQELSYIYYVQAMDMRYDENRQHETRALFEEVRISAFVASCLLRFNDRYFFVSFL